MLYILLAILASGCFLAESTQLDEPVGQIDGAGAQELAAVETPSLDGTVLEQDAWKKYDEKFCLDDLYTDFLKKQYRTNLIKKQGRKARWNRRQKLKASHYATETLASERKAYFGSIPVVLTPEVDFWINYFKTKGRTSFVKWLVRGENVREVIIPLLKQLGMPEELFYLSMIESGFNNRAYSRAKATGPWQFVAGTAKIYGLKMNYWVDERKDPVKSTIAAARYLRDLYKKFGNWYLAMAAYNAGPGKIRYAIRKLKTRDYWKISRSRYLRRETRNYVPKLLAALILGSNAEEHGFIIKPNPSEDVPTQIGRAHV